MDQPVGSSEDIATILHRRRAEVQQRRNAEPLATSRFVKMLVEFCDELSRIGFAVGTRYQVQGDGGIGPSGELSLVVLDRAVATGTPWRQSEWWDVVIGERLHPAIMHFGSDPNGPSHYIELLQSSPEEVVGLSDVMANRQQFNLDPQVMIINLQRALTRFRLAV